MQAVHGAVTAVRLGPWGFPGETGLVTKDPAALLAAVERMRAAAADVRLPLDLEGAASEQTAQRELVHQLDDYVLPRLRSLDAPLLAVVGGSTGAGKSTLVNSVLGEQVSRTGVIRPTTMASVLVHHEQDTRWFTDKRILPELARVYDMTRQALTKRYYALGGGRAPLTGAPDAVTPHGAVVRYWMARTEADVHTEAAIEVSVHYDGTDFRPTVPPSLLDGTGATRAAYVGELPRPGTTAGGRVYPMGEARHRIDVWIRAEQHPASS